LNAGTATLKAALFDLASGDVVETYRAEYEWTDQDGADIVARALEGIETSFDAVGHRVVHGGAAFTDPVRIDRNVEDALQALVPLAPLHNARALQVIRMAKRFRPDVPAFAAFDTAFHVGRPEESMRYALPAELVRSLALRRYGFHGIAHAGLVEELAAAQRVRPALISAVTLQLGAGCSACAVEDGRSIETSMGYTPLEGLVMATRCGDIDPAIVLQLARAGHSLDDIEEQLNRRSGLLALSGRHDVREILAAEARGDDAARLALGVFVRRIVLTVGAYLTLLGGRGAIVFGGGIGTHSPQIRERVLRGLRAWQVELDTSLNDANEVGRISPEGSRPVFAFRTNEERMIARAIMRLSPD
jgi:acetate kinase